MIFYISGHGFGHASRCGEVIRTLRLRQPDLAIAVRSSAPEWFLREQAGAGFAYEFLECDTGVLQADSLTVRRRETLQAWTEFRRGTPELVRSELGFIARFRPGLIAGDIPPAAFEIAAAASLPSLALANFSWDWIYQPYVRRYPEYAGELPPIRESYAKAGLLLRLPFSAGLEAFPRQEPIPLIARPSRLGREEARAALGLDPGRPLVLLSFGGFGLDEKLFMAMSSDPEIAWLASERVGAGLRGIRNFSREELAGRGLSYPDLVRAADIVATKPGYGILSECIANRTRMLYTDRGEFAEYPVLVEGARRSLPCRHISREDIRAGKLGAAARALLEEPADFADIPLNGAAAAAERILALLASGA